MNVTQTARKGFLTRLSLLWLMTNSSMQMCATWVQEKGRWTLVALGAGEGAVDRVALDTGKRAMDPGGSGRWRRGDGPGGSGHWRRRDGP